MQVFKKLLCQALQHFMKKSSLLMLLHNEKIILCLISEHFDNTWTLVQSGLQDCVPVLLPDNKAVTSLHGQRFVPHIKFPLISVTQLALFLPRVSKRVPSYSSIAFVFTFFSLTLSAPASLSSYKFSIHYPQK